MHDASLTAKRQMDIAHKAFDVMMKHYDFLHSQCYTDQDKFRFYDELLYLLRDKQEHKKQRKTFYHNNHKYRNYDVKRRIMNRIRSLI